MSEHVTNPKKLTQKAQVMGILNITPDSFSDGGQYLSLSEAIDKAAQIVNEGADIIDLGGESSRPGATPVSAAEEIARVIPVIEAIKQRFSIKISVDTHKTEVMQEALKRGIDIINDITALRTPGTLELIANSTNHKVSVCLMHMQGNPQTMQQAPHYKDVVSEVSTFLHNRVATCIQAGIAKERIIVDPGIGFGKTLAHNLALIRNLNSFTNLGCTLLVGFSRKRMLMELLGQDKSIPPEQRLYGGLALASWCTVQGTDIIRTHDVAATVDVLKVMGGICKEGICF